MKTFVYRRALAQSIIDLQPGKYLDLPCGAKITVDRNDQVHVVGAEAKKSEFGDSLMQLWRRNRGASPMQDISDPRNY